MASILLISASPYGADSRGHRLADQAVANLIAADPSMQLKRRDLTVLPEPVLARGYADAVVGGHAHDVPAFTLSEELIAEIEQADRMIIATPMHNFTVPAALKLWIDQVLRIGRSFVPQDGWKVGILADRPTLIVITSGGRITGADARQPDHLTGYLVDVLATIGIRDIRFIYLEGLVHADRAEAIVAAAQDTLAADPVFGSPVPA
ncbi:flavodoxin family protein [Altererythrobacter xixiisoli]|uniref:FMN dependent NADH:quinone oxidoreductase n=1 Tax=Croceibacterium xixiisoli TaxID=1476466 RepID=A0A6I4TT85_9SPHN|nr:NAD(P)H-dependent oxidoreductase [Croceibacterium xixiisoli]MXO98420.1 flavodoxin family protein [Croceibacterium xixiisoli]